MLIVVTIIKNKLFGWLRQTGRGWRKIRNYEKM
jgi:hypothetical protein